jgi:stress response protein SCP2
MIGEIPPEPSLEESVDDLTKNRIMLDRSREVFLNFASTFANSPSFTNYKRLKKSNEMLGLTFKNYTFSIIDLGEVDDVNKQKIIAELFIEDQMIRVDKFNELTDSMIFYNHVPSDIQKEPQEIDEGENDDEEKEIEETETEEAIEAIEFEEWVAEVVHYQHIYAESDLIQLRKTIVNTRINPRVNKLIEFGIRAKDPSKEIAKTAAGTTIGVAAGIIIARTIDRRS